MTDTILGSFLGLLLVGGGIVQPSCPCPFEKANNVV